MLINRSRLKYLDVGVDRQELEGKKPSRCVSETSMRKQQGSGRGD